MEAFKHSLPRVDSYIRILHALPKAPNVDVYVNGSLIASNMAFGKISDYNRLTPGDYKIQLFTTGTYDKPLITQTIQLAPNASYTISVVSLSNSIYLFKLKDDNIPLTKDPAFLRFINLSYNAPLVSLALPNSDVLFNGAEYLETTGYYQLSSGIYNFQILFTTSKIPSKFIKNITLNSSNFYTIYLLGLFNDKPPLGYLLVTDRI